MYTVYRWARIPTAVVFIISCLRPHPAPAADNLILFLQPAGQEDGQVENKYELSLITSLTL